MNNCVLRTTHDAFNGKRDLKKKIQGDSKELNTFKNSLLSNCIIWTSSVHRIVEIHLIFPKVCRLKVARISTARGNELLSNRLLKVLHSFWINLYVNSINNFYTGCFKKSFTTLKAYRNLYRGHTHGFELSKCSKTHRVLPRIVMVQCDFHW